MARKKRNKSQAIREALASHPDKRPQEIAALLAKQGIKVAPTYISVVKSAAKSKAKPKPGRSAKRESSVLNTVLQLVLDNGFTEVASAMKTIENLRS